MNQHSPNDDPEVRLLLTRALDVQPPVGRFTSEEFREAPSARLRRRSPAVIAAAVITALILLAVPLALTHKEQPSRPLAQLDGAAPGTATVTCGKTGTRVTPQRVRASADGIHLKIVNEAQEPGMYLNHVGGGDPVPLGTSTRVLTNPPGAVDVWCVQSTGTQKAQHVQLDVIDPDRRYQSIDTSTILGCEPNHGIADGPSVQGDTAQGAAQALAASLGTDPTLVRGSGYIADTARPYLVRVGSTRGKIGVEPVAAGGFRASLHIHC